MSLLSFRRSCLLGSAALVAMAAPAVVHAQVQTYEFNIPAQDLGSALRTYARQSRQQIMFDGATITGKTSPALMGRYSADDGLARLLVGSGFSATRGAQGAMMVRPAAPGNDDRPRSSANVEELVVTAQRRSERLIDVPISVSVVTGTQLDRSTDTSMSSVLRRVSGVAISESFLGMTSQVTIRGVTAGPVSGGASTTAYYLDTVPFGFTKQSVAPDPDVYDLDRVEVLRGPQGTLYGAGALNGVVRILTNPANPARVEAKGRVEGSSTENGGQNFRADAAVNLPLVADKVAVRVVGGYQSLGGWIDGPTKKDLNSGERLNARVRLDAKPTEHLSLGASWWISRTELDSPNTANTSDQRRDELGEPISTDYDVYGLTGSYDFGGAILSSATSYLTYKNQWLLNLSPPSRTSLYDGRLPAKTFSQEVTLNSAADGAWRWSVGGLYRRSKDSLSYFISGGSQRVWNIDTRQTEAYAAFGELTRVFLDGRLELTGGLRYFQDELTQREVSRANNAPANQLVNTSGKFDSTSPRVILTWHPSETSTLYASYGRGFRSGIFQSPGTLLIDPTLPNVRPDTLTNYEVGGKIGRSKFSLEGAVFYIDWKDVQQQIVLFSPFLQQNVSAVVNGTSASGFGLEVSATVEPIERLRLGGSFSVSDLGFEKDIISQRLITYKKGDRPGYSSKYTAGAFLDYSVPMGRFEGLFSLSATYTSGVSYPAIGGNPAVVTVTKSDDILLARSTLSVRSPQGWEAGVFADNLLNDRGSPLLHNTVPDRSISIRPRTFGFQLSHQF